MNKIELTKRIEGMGEYEPFVDEPISKRAVLNDISKLTEPPKVVLSGLTAGYLVHCRSYGLSLGYALTAPNTICEEQVSPDVLAWLSLKNNQELFARAWLDGYEIEQEKLYTVEIPNPNTDAITCLARDEETGKIVIDCLWEMAEVKNGWKLDNDYQLTESEIRKDFDWAWQAGFAKPVEEVDDENTYQFKRIKVTR